MNLNPNILISFKKGFNKLAELRIRINQANKSTQNQKKSKKVEHTKKLRA